MTTICDQSLALYTEPCSLVAKLWISDPLGFQVLVKFAKESARQNKWAWITLKHPFSETLEDSGMLSGQSQAKLWMFIAFSTHQVHANLPQEVHCAESHGCMGRGSKKQYYTGIKKNVGLDLRCPFTFRALVKPCINVCVPSMSTESGCSLWAVKDVKGKWHGASPWIDHAQKVEVKPKFGMSQPGPRIWQTWDRIEPHELRKKSFYSATCYGLAFVALTQTSLVQ